ncbi:unnamed protein product, partial [Chrysoparadoxa australica]
MVNEKQDILRDFLLDAQPSWLRKCRTLQRRRRWNEIRLLAISTAVEEAHQCVGATKKRGKAYGAEEEASMALAKVQGKLQAIEDSRRLSHESVVREREARAETGERELLEAVEVAEREIEVASRARQMAEGLGKWDEVAAIEIKLDEWTINLRDRRKLHQDWSRKTVDTVVPLLREWLPPEEAHLALAASIGRQAGQLA